MRFGPRLPLKWLTKLAKVGVCWGVWFPWPKPSVLLKLLKCHRFFALRPGPFGRFFWFGRCAKLKLLLHQLRQGGGCLSHRSLQGATGKKELVTTGGGLTLDKQLLLGPEMESTFRIFRWFLKVFAGLVFPDGTLRLIYLDLQKHLLQTLSFGGSPAFHSDTRFLHFSRLQHVQENESFYIDDTSNQILRKASGKTRKKQKTTRQT